MLLEKNRITLVAILPLIAGALIIAGLALKLFNQDINDRLESLRYEQEQHIKHELEARVGTIYDIVETCYTQGKSENECLANLGNMNFGEDNSNYIWIHRLEPNDLDSAFLISHPRKAILGRNLAGYIDLEHVDQIYHRGKIIKKESLKKETAQPKNIFTTFNVLAMKSGEGFVKYYWPKSTQGAALATGYPKTSYIKFVEPFSWVIGAGEYEDIIEEQVNIEKEKLLSSRNKFLMIFSGSFLVMLTVLVGLSTVISRKFFDSLKESEKKIILSAQQLKKSEKRLYDIASNSGDVIWEIDISFKYVFVSGDTKSIFGVDSSTIIGESMFERVSQGTVEAFKESIFSLQQDMKPIEDMECKLASNEKDLFIKVKALPVVDESGNFSGYRGVYRDISKQKEEELQQQYLERELQQAHKMEAVGTLAAGIAHEINTPAQFVATNLEFLDESFEDVKELVTVFVCFLDQMKENEDNSENLKNLKKTIEDVDWEYLEEEIPITLTQSKEGVQRISTIVTAMKEFSHPGSKEKIAVDIVKVLDTTATVSRNEWKYVAELETRFSENLPMISGFPDELGQVFLNLVVNAAHAIEGKLGDNPEGEKGTIVIDVEDDNECIIVKISDTGIGIAPDVKAKVFDPFFTTKKVGKGTGQGLAIAHDVIAGKHNGSITLETELGLGSVFIVRLPKHEQKKASTQNDNE